MTLIFLPLRCGRFGHKKTTCKGVSEKIAVDKIGCQTDKVNPRIPLVQEPQIMRPGNVIQKQGTTSGRMGLTAPK